MASNIPTAFSQRKKALNLFRWTNKRYRGILIAYILLLSVSSPLMELIIKLKNRNIEEVVNAAPMLIGTTFTLVAMIFSTVFAFVSFSYIHNKRCVDMFGSFPVDRATMLFTRLFSVIFQTVIPIFIVGLISAMMTFDLDGFLHVSRNVLFVARQRGIYFSSFTLLWNSCGYSCKLYSHKRNLSGMRFDLLPVPKFNTSGIQRKVNE